MQSVKLQLMILSVFLPISFSLATLASTDASSDVIRQCSKTSLVGDFCRIEVSQLRPTQITVGMITVQEKQREISKKKKDPTELNSFLKKKYEPVVIGPRENFYIVDHHHLARALWEEKIATTYASIIANYSNLDQVEFWKVMNEQNWIFPFDENGNGPLSWENIPKNISDLRDDPYRSLATRVRDEGGYKKTKILYAEAQWANFFRKRIRIQNSDSGQGQDFEGNFETAVEQALVLAHSSEAKDLPGYIPDDLLKI